MDQHLGHVVNLVVCSSFVPTFSVSCVCSLPLRPLQAAHALGYRLGPGERGTPSNLLRGFQRFGFEKRFRALPGWGFLRFRVRVSFTYCSEFTRS